MPKESEMVIRLPFFDEAVQAIKENGEYQRELTAQELAGIMYGIITSLTKGQEKIRTSIPSMTVKIENTTGIVSGSVSIESPIKADIELDCTLTNDTVPGRIKLARLEIQQKAGFAAKLALKAVNIEGKAREALRDPNQALSLALASQLEPRGIELTEVGLHFNESTLTVNLKGKPTTPEK